MRKPAPIARRSSQQAALAGLTAMESWSGVDALPDVTSPTLVLWGDRDQSYRWDLTRILWDRIPRASLAVMPACSHAAHLEKPALFNAIVRDFLLDY